MDNIILIGMPGCGKSTCGVIVAKTLCKDFCDTDLLIQKNEKMSLQELIDTKGSGYFGEAEERAICGHGFHNCVVATGGSVIYSEKAMEHLKKNSLVVYLKISFGTMLARISDFESRGILLRNGETVGEMYAERQPLYEKYTDVTVDCDGVGTEKAVRLIVEAVARARCLPAADCP